MWIGSVKIVANSYNTAFDEVLKWNFDRFMVFYNLIVEEQNEINRMLEKTKTKYNETV